MHTKPMEDSEGTFSEPECIDTSCPKCEEKTLYKQVWESNCGSYEDIRVKCRNCPYVEWIEGLDS